MTEQTGSARYAEIIQVQDCLGHGPPELHLYPGAGYTTFCAPSLLGDICSAGSPMVRGEATIFVSVTEQGYYSQEPREHLSVRSLGSPIARAPPVPRSWAAPQQSVPGKSQSPRVAEIGVQAHRRDRHQPVTAGPTNIRDKQMAKGKHRKLLTNQSNMALCKPNSPTTASPG